MDKRESFYWDLVKGAAVFLMLWGHCIQYCGLDTISCFEDKVFKAIYSFHMPVFMIVSGFLFCYSFQKRNLPDLLEHRLRGMLQPIVMATVLSNVLMLLPIYILSDRVDFLFGSLFVGIDSAFWFLWAVLYCSLVVGICCKLTSNLWLQVLLLIAGAFAILLVPQWNMTLFMYPYFVAGFFGGMYRTQAKKLYRIAKYAAWIAFPILLAFYRKEHYVYITPMFSEELGLRISAEIACFRWIIGFAGSIWLLSVMEFLLRLGERIPAVCSCMKAVTYLGKNSLQIYCLSMPLLTGYMRHLYRKIAELMGGNPFARNQFFFDFLFTPLLAAAWSAALYYMVVLLKKWKLHRLIFGR